MNRAENLRRIATEEFDLCIIGGGASGAGCALDAALRGLKVALIEKTDFAAETSSRSTKLIHGGVRYLEQAIKKFDFAQLRQVRHGLEERHLLLRNAPHLAQPLGLITPVFSWWEGFYFSVGLKLYDWFAHGKGNFPPSRWLSKKEALHMMPGLSARIHSAILYYDGQMDDARYCLALVQSAAEAGAVVANHLEVVGFQKNSPGKLTAASLKNHAESGAAFTVKARLFLNCTGPYADHIRLLANPDLSPRIQPSKGVHLVLPPGILDSDQAMLIPKTRDGRMVFAIPFEGNLLLGTTDQPYHYLGEEPFLLSKEVDFLLDTLQPFVSKKIEKKKLMAGFGGIRPLISPSLSQNGNPVENTKSLLRDHEVEHDQSSGLISLLGGKWTTYRLMAKDAVDLVCRELGVSAVCKTQEQYLVGAEGFEPDLWKKLQVSFHFEEDICRHLAAKYGGRATRLSAMVAEQKVMGDRILPGFPFLKAEVVYAVREEMALSIRDFLARRIRLEFSNWEASKQAALVVAALMGKEMGWNTDLITRFASDYQSLIEGFEEKAIEA